MERRTACSLVGGNRVLEFETDSFSDGNIQSDYLLMLWNQFPIPIPRFTEVVSLVGESDLGRGPHV